MKHQLVLGWKEALLLVLLFVALLTCLLSLLMEWWIFYELVCQLGLCFTILKAKLMAVGRF